ncbi:MAG: RelA/SpoT family protein [Candidatus Berkelbacteria bacterium]|nr:RelA/SpoT family protein [Candidatus Berkelbacteria bacterium]
MSPKQPLIGRKIEEGLKRFPLEEREQIIKAYLLAKERHFGQKRRSGTAYIAHPVRVALELARDNYDYRTVAAGFLHDVLEDTKTESSEITKLFDPEIARIVDGVTKVSTIKLKNKAKIFSDHRHFLDQVDNYRKILFATTSDPRVMILKLYDRLDNVRTIRWLPQRKIVFYARETIEIFAPIAERLGMGLVKTKLEDLSFRYAYPQDYAKFKKSIAGLYKNPEENVARMLPEVKKALRRAKIKVISLSGRAKGEYSLYKKIERKGSVNTIYDIMALRVIVASISDCYRALGVIHSLYEPIPGEIDDYIAKPKKNGYRSIHTTIKDQKHNIFEIQIRTEEMHEQAEYGANTAHWNYKEISHGSALKGHAEDWTKELEKLKNIKNKKEFLSELTEQLFAEQIFAFTPKGDIINLPVGSTPIDFAYRIHSSLGNRCTGARINGRIVPLNTPINTSEVVEIIAGKAANPSSDWLRFIKTSQARQHIRAFLRQNQEEELIAAGKMKLAESAEKFSLELLSPTEADRQIEKSRLPYNSYSRSLVAIGEGAMRTMSLLRVLYPKFNFSNAREAKPAQIEEAENLDLLKNIRHEFAKCCKPKPSDKIIGYLGREHIIKVHKISCKRIKGAEQRRLIEL